MLWLSRPPLLRPLLATLIVAFGIGVELTPERTVPYPFARTDIAAGTTISTADVVFRSVPADLFTPIDLPVVGDRSLRAGEPILAGGVEPLVPSDWWALELPAPEAARPGAEVLVVLTRADEGHGSVRGVVVSSGLDSFGANAALVAVPEAWAEDVARADDEDGVTVLVGR